MGVIAETRIEVLTLPEISNIMCLPSQTDGVVTEHVHPASPAQQALSRFEGCVPFAQDEHRLVLVVSRVDGYGLVAFNEV